MENQELERLEQEESHKCVRRYLQSRTSQGRSALRETEWYPTRELHSRLNALLSDCDAVAQAEGVEICEAVEDVCACFADLLSFPAPTVYLDGDKKWCFDWDDREDGKGVYSRLETEEKLLVIVDEGDRHLRLPCLLNEVEPIRHLRYGLMQVFGE